MTIHPEKWQRIKTLMRSALELDVDEWTEFLATHCSDDPQVRDAVRSLLEEHRRIAETFLEGPLLKEDSAIGIILSVFFGVGIVLLTRIQKMPGGNQTGLDHFLFGQAATVGADEVRLMAVVGAVVLAAGLYFLWRALT